MINTLLNDKSVKNKEKTEILSQYLLENKISIDDLITAAAASKKEANKATCIEAIEFATKHTASIANEKCLAFVSAALAEKAPRIKWESARVIGNIAHLYPSQLDIATNNLLENTSNSGTVVRWSAAFALGEILKLKNSNYEELRSSLENICEQEEKNSIKKIYLNAFKKTK
jgi:hypothetical protein